MNDADLPIAELAWDCSCRLIPTRFPPVTLYDRVADPADLAAVFAIEMMTNPRLRQVLGELSIVPESERVSGPGTTPIMAAFTHLNPDGSRFSDGTFGVYYAALDLETAVAEVSHHRAVFLGFTREPAIEVDMRNYRAYIVTAVTDVRGMSPTMADIYSPDSYAASQILARRLRSEGGRGVAYDSVRRAGGECVALFTPKAIVPPVRQAEHISLVWDGTRISGWYEKSGLHEV
ncbi:RES family NAD+ phosphorylase [soil metagenome]